MTLKEISKVIFVLTCAITTVYILSISLFHHYFYTMFDLQLHVPISSLYQYPLTGFLSALPTLIFINSDQTSKTGWRIRLVLHFLLTITLTILSISLSWYGWHSWHYLLEFVTRGYFNVVFIIFMLIYIIAIYLFRRQQKKLSAQLNAQIKSFHEYTHEEKSDDELI